MRRRNVFKMVDIERKTVWDEIHERERSGIALLEVQVMRRQNFYNK